MNRSTILFNQAETDLLELKKDIDAGLFDDTQKFAVVLKSIHEKMREALENRKFEKEQDLATETLGK